MYVLSSKYRQRDVAKGIFFLFELLHTYAHTYCEIPKKQFARKTKCTKRRGIFCALLILSYITMLLNIEIE